MANLRPILLAGILALVIPALPAYAASEGRPVPTETIIVPRDDEQVMPDVPADAEEVPAVEAPAPEEPAASSDDEPLPVVEYDLGKLPTPVRRLREQIIEAAKTGDVAKLRPIIDAQDEPPEFSFDESSDPIAYLKSLSGDPEGREILAILIEVLEAGYVHVDVGTPDEMYVWPYFARYPVDKLTPPQLVELFRIVFAGDYEDMKTYGTYLSFRVGIAPNGVWKFFLAGD